MEREIINKVAQSALVTIDLEDLYHEGERVFLDIKPWLFEEMILREKDFRLNVKEHDWEQYRGKMVAVGCSVDAIVPTWAYMLLATKLQPFASRVVMGSLEDLERELFIDAIDNIDFKKYEGSKVVIKGCSSHPVPASAYVKITEKVRPFAASIMYGEPCSTVPIYKKPREKKS